MIHRSFFIDTKIIKCYLIILQSIESSLFHPQYLLCRPSARSDKLPRFSVFHCTENIPYCTPFYNLNNSYVHMEL